MNLRGARRDPQPPFVTGDGLCVASEIALDIAQMEMRFGEIGLQRARTLVTRERRHAPLQTQLRVAVKQMRDRIRRIRIQDRGSQQNRPLRIVRLQGHEAQAGERPHMLRLHLQHSFVRRERLLVTRAPVMGEGLSEDCVRRGFDAGIAQSHKEVENRATGRQTLLLRRSKVRV